MVQFSGFLILVLMAGYLLFLMFFRKGWVISQEWKDVVFLHYKVDFQELQKKVPFPLDLYKGEAIVSIVPFVMSKIRFPYLPAVPGFSQLLELNLRTYVLVNGKPGVYFFTLDSNHLPGVLIARWFFFLPYRWMKLKFSHQNQYEFTSPEISLKATVGAARISNEFDRWSTERYSLFTKRGEIVYQGIVEHLPWALQELHVITLNDNFSSLIGEQLKMKSLFATSYCQSLSVRFRPFIRI